MSTPTLTITELIDSLSEQIGHRKIAWSTGVRDEDVISWAAGNSSPNIEQKLRLVVLADLLNQADDVTAEVISAIRDGNFDEAIRLTQA